ncbi:hypothetical protein Sango_2360200 [Sesamum angolense]|uniref:Ubiquitin-like domain-containing protein n=1 Tax=Sesamum angolense TaxID=2727404 RepID=A0AAE1W698_9LAMI|nr:hypothetical protein Sango_2360200 [Sesamum angolense]
MKLVAEILTGSLFFVEVEDNATVGDLKKKIGEQEHLPTRRLILILNADERLLLNGNDVCLKDYGVQDSSHIYIFFKPLDHDTPSSPSTPKDSASSEPSQNKQDQTEPSDETDDSTPSESDQNEPSDEEDDESTPSADSSSDQQED